MNKKIGALIVITLVLTAAVQFLTALAFTTASNHYTMCSDFGYVVGKSTSSHFGLFNNGQVAAGSVTTSSNFTLIPGILDAMFNCPAPTPPTPTVVSGVNINGANPSVLTLTPNATTNIDVEATITGSCGNITAGTTTILLYRSGVTSSTCLTAPNNLNCYIATAFTQTGSCSGGSENTTTTFPVQYYAQATDSSSSFPNQNWIGTVLFTDSSLATSSAESTHATSSNVMSTMVALNVAPTSISYGTLTPGTDTSSTNQSVGVTNAGNASTTIQVSGNALASGSNTIATSSQHYATSTFTFGGSEQLLSDTATTITGVSIAPVVNYPITGGGWAKSTALIAPEISNVLVAYNGYLYNIGGLASTTSLSVPTTTVLFARLNATGSIGAWSSTKPLNYSLYNHTAVAYNGYMYTIGGNASSGSNASTTLFAPINSSGSIGNWTSTKALPYTSIYHSSVAYNGYIYTLGGTPNGGINPTATVLFAPLNSTGSIGNWTSTTAMPAALQNQASVVYNGYLYTIGGCPTSFCGSLTSTVIFAPINSTGSLGAWTSTQAMPYANSYHASLAYNGYLYALGGLPTGGATSTVLYAPISSTGSIGAWGTTQALPYTNYGPQGATVFGGYLYSAGGYGNGRVTSSVIFAPLDARSTYWGASAPVGYPAGTYTATVTFTGMFSP